MVVSGCQDSLEFPEMTTTTTTSSTTITTTSTSSTTTTTLLTVATPYFVTSPGSYEVNSLTITIECSTPGATIYWTAEEASASSFKAFSTSSSEATVTIYSSKTIRAYAAKSGYQDSASVEASFDLWNWTGFGSGMDDQVNALAIDSSGNLYAGGTFTTAGGVPANYIAKWDGSTWEALGTGMDNDVHALAVDSSGNLYAGGEFSFANGAYAPRVAKWKEKL